VNKDVKEASEKIFKQHDDLFRKLAKYEQMEKEQDKEEFFKCGCAGEGIMVTQFYDEPEHFYFSYWKLGSHPRKLPFWHRLKLSLKLLFKGDIFEDEVILDGKEARRLANWIKQTEFEHIIQDEQESISTKT